MYKILKRFALLAEKVDNRRYVMLKWICNRYQWIKKQNEKVRIIFLYRYISLITTSLFFFFGNSENSTGNKVFIILCIAISSVILSILYLKIQEQTGKIKFLVFIETIGNTFILIPSGGLSSPFVWYSINTLLVASLELTKLFAWINLLIYLFFAVLSSRLFLNVSTNSISRILVKDFNAILSLILITMAIQLLSSFMNRIKSESQKVKNANESLKKANIKIKESMNYIMELYQAVHLFTPAESMDELIELVVEYAKKVTKAKNVYFYRCTDNEVKLFSNEHEKKQETGNEVKKILSDKLHNSFENSEEIMQASIKNSSYIIAPVRTSYKVYGFLTVNVENGPRSSGYQDIIEQMGFLSGLSAIVLERFELDKVKERLLVTEEQNRIANEIHDNVLQRLFSVSCGVFSLLKNMNKYCFVNAREELKVIQDSLNHAMDDLRSAIYGLSWRKSGTDSFIVKVNNYINETRLLNNVDIKFTMAGDDAFLQVEYKKALYRIICEAVGNAVHHGKANHIGVDLLMNENTTRLKVIDDGVGFDTNKVINMKEGGIGIHNIFYLVHSMNGSITLNSNEQEGTVLEITVSNKRNMGVDAV